MNEPFDSHCSLRTLCFPGPGKTNYVLRKQLITGGMG